MSECPDDLVHFMQRGGGTLEQRRQLMDHIETCDDCRLSLALARDFDAVLETQSGDDEVATRIAAQITRKPQRRFRPAAWVAAAILLGATGAAAGTSQNVRKAILQTFWHESPKQADEARSVGIATSRPLPSTAPAPVLPAQPQPETAEPLEPRQAVAKEPKRTAKPEGEDSAESLFVTANAHRREGRFADAQRAYLSLQQRYPGSPEALVSHVSLGRMLKGAAPAQALAHFTAYLAQSKHTTLAAEALYGKASALSSLGDHAAEDAAWNQLLKRFPSSVYAEQARTQLEK